MVSRKWTSREVATLERLANAVPVRSLHGAARRVHELAHAMKRTERDILHALRAPQRRAAKKTGKERSLWEQYRTHPTDALRRDLVALYVPRAQRLAVRLLGGGHETRLVSADDLAQVGLVGFIEAMDRFDLSRNSAPSTFFGRRMRGAMVDFLRGWDWVPRSVRRKIRDGFIEETKIGSLDSPGGEGRTPRDLVADPRAEPADAALCREDFWRHVQALLSPRQWAVIKLHYLDGLTNTVIAERLGCKYQAVSLTLRTVRRKFRDRLRDRHDSLQDLLHTEPIR